MIVEYPNKDLLNAAKTRLKIKNVKRFFVKCFFKCAGVYLIYYMVRTTICYAGIIIK